MPRPSRVGGSNVSNDGTGENGFGHAANFFFFNLHDGNDVLEGSAIGEKGRCDGAKITRGGFFFLYFTG